eukprot:GHVU01014562.1.p1 GENE.GHVU01014562.1~~GHVU01014562.1.p1  ORF type:complete len:110 (-),score=0.67 GHVU01014562.1:143-472(-)
MGFCCITRQSFPARGRAVTASVRPLTIGCSVSCTTPGGAGRDDTPGGAARAATSVSSSSLKPTSREAAPMPPATATGLVTCLVGHFFTWLSIMVGFETYHQGCTSTRFD